LGLRLASSEIIRQPWPPPGKMLLGEGISETLLSIFNPAVLRAIFRETLLLFGLSMLMMLKVIVISENHARFIR
jgi:hypothetical protein